jgi:hypothetical protein
MLRLLLLSLEDIDSLDNAIYDQNCLSSVRNFIARPRPSTAYLLPFHVCKTISERDGQDEEVIKLAWLTGEITDEDEYIMEESEEDEGVEVKPNECCIS